MVCVFERSDPAPRKLESSGTERRQEAAPGPTACAVVFDAAAGSATASAGLVAFSPDPSAPASTGRMRPNRRYPRVRHVVGRDLVARAFVWDGGGRLEDAGDGGAGDAGLGFDGAERPATSAEGAHPLDVAFG
jgi:hypothetical protein